jgi:peptidoglycan/xylan/chitin deacetylase (PgdA/CDA1 family)
VVSAARVAFVASSSGLGLCALGRAFGHGPSLGELSLAGLAFGTLATSGVFFPWLQMFGDVVCRGPLGQNRVALTFDDGPDPRTTPRVLERLQGTRHRATFFVLGEKSRRHPAVLREILAAGHALALHGDVHDRLHSFRTPWRVRDELVRAQDAVEQAAGVRPRWFRPPIGHTSPGTVRGAQLSGVTLVGWSARGYDGVRGRRPESVVRAVAKSLGDGAIVLLHDAAERDDFEPASLNALPELLNLLDSRALSSVTLDSWLPTP